MLAAADVGTPRHFWRTLPYSWRALAISPPFARQFFGRHLNVTARQPTPVDNAVRAPRAWRNALARAPCVTQTGAGTGVLRRGGMPCVTFCLTAATNSMPFYERPFLSLGLAAASSLPIPFPILPPPLLPTQNIGRQASHAAAPSISWTNAQIWTSDVGWFYAVPALHFPYYYYSISLPYFPPSQYLPCQQDDIWFEHWFVNAVPLCVIAAF